ncbi:MAG: cyclic nucleotide-binding domain-containing protein [Myxococcota bacterium]
MPHVDLLELPYFEGISVDALVSLVDKMEPAPYRVGDVLVREGEKAPPPLFIATSGRVSIIKRTASNGERTLAELDSPTLFGEIELFCQIPAVATVRALTAVQTYRLTRATFDQLFAQKHAALTQFTLNVARVACHRLAVADEMLARFLADQDLADARRTIFSSMGAKHHWPEITGAFKRPTR